MFRKKNENKGAENINNIKKGNTDSIRFKRNGLSITNSTIKSNMYHMFTAPYCQGPSTSLTKDRQKAALTEFQLRETELRHTVRDNTVFITDAREIVQKYTRNLTQENQTI